MKTSTLFTLILLLASCASEQAAKPTPAEQVEGLQKMCKNSTEAIKARQAKKSLYLRLGGKEKIRTMVKGIVKAHAKNKQIGHMFKYINKKSVIENTTNFLVLGTGGKAKYAGRDMKATHKHMKITNSDFLSAGGDVQNVMKGMKYGENEIQEIVCALTSFVPVVVKK